MSSWERRLEEDIDWRFEELASLKLQIAGHGKGTTTYRSLLRAMWAMLYAHYEGFCLFALRVYLDQLEKLGLKREECKEALVVFSFEKEFRQFRGDTSSPNCFKFFAQKLGLLLKSNLEFVRNDENEYDLTGRSNLYPKHLTENCNAVCLTVPVIATYEDKLRALVGRRNGIAHGKKIIIATLEDYQLYEEAASNVMLGIAYAIIDAMSNKTFLKEELEYHL